MEARCDVEHNDPRAENARSQVRGTVSSNPKYEVSLQFNDAMISHTAPLPHGAAEQVTCSYMRDIAAKLRQPARLNRPCQASSRTPRSTSNNHTNGPSKVLQYPAMQRARKNRSRYKPRSPQVKNSRNCGVIHVLAFLYIDTLSVIINSQEYVVAGSPLRATQNFTQLRPHASLAECYALTKTRQCLFCKLSITHPWPPGGSFGL